MKSNVHTSNFVKRVLKPTKKGRFIVSSMQNFINSRLAQHILVTIVCITFAVTRKWWYILSIPVAMFGYQWRRLAFEFFVLLHYIELQLGLFQWYTLVDDNLILGAIPMQDHQIETFQKLNIQAVVSIVQPWELDSCTFFGCPMNPDDWKRAGIKQYILPSPDFVPPSFEVLDEGAKILDRHLSNSERVYVHCKSGVGRSASVVLAYLLKFKGEDLITLHKRLKARRTVVFSEHSTQMKNMLQYEKFHHRGNFG
jgi:protein-tyrosine phosphatase